MSKQWVKVSDESSWHIVEEEPADGVLGITLCGRSVPRGTEIRADFGNERSCESCLRIAAEE